MLSRFHVLRVVCVLVRTQSLMKVTVESPKRLNNYELGLMGGFRGGSRGSCDPPLA